MMRTLIKTHLNPRLICMIFLGFACGLPFFLTVSTLNYRLHESGVSLSLIGLFSWIGLPHALKFLIGPVLDRISIPYFTNKLGRRRSWMLVAQSVMIVGIFGLGLSDPSKNLFIVAFWALLVSTCSAFDHIAMTTYRIEILEEKQQASGAALTIVGYRIGNLISGAGALVLAQYFSWETAYCLIAFCGLIGIITILLNPEPESYPHENNLSFKEMFVSYLDLIKMHHIYLILFFVTFFRLSDHLIGGVSNIFYASLGFSKIEIANIIKIYGLIPTIIGGLIGGVVTNKIGLRKALLMFGILETLSPMLYLTQWFFGKNFNILYLTITIEQLTTGMAASVFMAYISNLCSNTNITATRYSQLSSLKSLGWVVCGTITGLIIDSQGWPVFFMLCTLISIPCLFLIIKMQEHFPLHLKGSK